MVSFNSMYATTPSTKPQLITKLQTGRTCKYGSQINFRYKTLYKVTI